MSDWLTLVPPECKVMPDWLTLGPPESKVMPDWLTPAPPECKVMSDWLTLAPPECKVVSDWFTPAPPECKVMPDWLKILVTSPKHWFFVWRGRKNGGGIQIFWFFGLFWGGRGWKSLDFSRLKRVLTEAEVDFWAIGAWEPCDLGEMRAEEGLQEGELCGFGFGQEMDFTEEGFDGRSGCGL